MFFDGIHDVAQDDKSRIALPTKFRPAVGLECANQLICTRHHQENCLTVYAPEDWAGVASQLATIPALDQAGQYLRSILLGYKSELKIDKQGRFLIPQRLRDEIGLKGEAVLLGVGSNIQIWNPDAYAEYKARALEANRQLNPDLAQQSPTLQTLVF